MFWQRLDRAHSPWGETDTIIDHWLQERQALLKVYVSMSKLSTVHGHTDSIPLQEIERAQIQNLLNLLIDYVSILHLELLEKIYALELSLWNKHQIKIGLNPALSEQLFKIINPILDFEKHCRKILKQSPDTWNTLKTPLSELGEQLAERMRLEDALIHAYLLARLNHESIQA